MAAVVFKIRGFFRDGVWFREISRGWVREGILFFFK